MNFKEFNSRKRAEWCAQQRQLIVFFNDTLVVFSHGKNTETIGLRLSEYHQVKDEAHALVMKQEPFDTQHYLRRAARLFLEELHRVMQLVKDPVEKWKGTIIACCGGPSPREGHAAMQYFERLRGTEKVYYVENVDEPFRARDIVAQLEVERAFFDPIRDMRRDILSDETQKFLAEVCK